MPDVTLLFDDAGHKLQLLTAAGTTAPPTLGTDGQPTDAWRVGSGSFCPRRAAIRVKASIAANMTAISVWAFYDGAWSKIYKAPDMTFVAGDLDATFFVDSPIGTRIAVAYTLSAGNATVTAYPLESSFY